MEVVNSLKFSMRFLGFREEDNKMGIQIYIFMVIEGIIIVNLVYFLIDRWHDMDDRVIALKTITLFVTYFAYSATIVLYWDEYSSVIKLFYHRNYEFPFKVSSERKRYVSSMENNMERLNKTWLTILKIYVTPFNIIPMVIVIFKVTLFSEDFNDVIKQNFSAPLPLYYPEYLKRFNDLEWLMNVLVYVNGYVLHVTYITLVALYSHLAHSTVLCAITNLEFELKLLRLSVIEMDDIVVSLRGSFDDTEHTALLNEALEHFQKYLVRHHQDTYRRYKLVNTGIRWIAASIGTTAALFMCMSIYMAVQKDQIILQFQEAFMCVLWAIARYLFDVCGEKVKTEDENLRNSLYECSWLEKPSWFKKSLLFMMTRTSQSVEIKPFGLYAFNLNVFAKTINAAYSYYNLLHNFKSK